MNRSRQNALDKSRLVCLKCGRKFEKPGPRAVHEKYCEAQPPAETAGILQDAKESSGMPEPSGLPAEIAKPGIPVDRLQLIFAAAGDYASKSLGEKFKLSVEEAKYLAEIWKPVYDQYVSRSSGPLVPAVAGTALLVASRVLGDVFILIHGVFSNGKQSTGTRGTENTGNSGNEPAGKNDSSQKSAKKKP